MYISYHKSQYPSAPQPLSFQPRKAPSFTGALLPSLALITRTDGVENYHAILSTPMRLTLFLIPFYRNWSPIFKNKKIKFKGTWRRLLRVSWTPRRSNQSILKEILNIHWKDWCWSSNTLAIWCEELTLLKRPWCWGRLRAGGEGDREDEVVGWHHRLNGRECE